MEWQLVRQFSIITVAILNTGFHSAFDYIYVLFWNSLWTLAPVVGIGLFDRFLGA
jgi:hypothetical protein